MQDRRAAQIGRWAVAAMFAANGLVMGAWAPQIPLLLPRHGITEATLGLLILVLGLGAVGSMLFAGRMIARFGSRAVLQAFALALVPVLPMVVYAESIPVVALTMALLGALIGTMDVAMNANAVEVERRMGRATMSALHGFWSLGGAIGGSAGGILIKQYGSEQQALLAAAITLTMVLAAMPFLVAEAPARAAFAGDKAQKPDLFPRDAALWILGAMALFSMVPEGAVLDWAALYLTKELGSDVATSGFAFAFFSGAMAIMRFAGDAIRNRFGAVATLRWSGVLGAVGLMGGAAATSDWMAIASFAVAGLGVANMVPIMFSAAGNHPGLSAGAGIATVTMVGYCGILVAPSSIGFIAEHAGFRMTYAALALLLLVVSMLAARTVAADGVRRMEAAQ